MSRFADAETLWTFVHSGSAIFTVVSLKSHTRFTYRMRAADKDDLAAPVRFVDLLTGPCNTRDYTYIGFTRQRIFVAKGESPGVEAFKWLYARLSAGVLPSTCWVHHEGRCGRCGRVLTVPESLAAGLGPECAGRVG